TGGGQQEPEVQEETGGGQQEPETVQKPEDELRQEADSPGSGSKADASEDESESGPDPEKKRFRGLAGMLSGLWKRLCRAAAFLASLPERMLELPDKLQDFFWAADDRLERLSWRLESLRQRIEPYRTPESIALYKRLLWRLKYLWKHFGPRRLSGWLRFGTGAPDKTGQLAGLLYLILPASAEDFEVRPDFTEPVLEADLVIKGHIRACHLLRMAFGLWRDKELRKMIRRIKGGNENG
ncbi:MAG: hypothetical protein Q4E91_07655, partial [Lachnospiraceae bacterium]|nr:hypothetical protein [Lachnospiraceae bacterium]